MNNHVVWVVVGVVFALGVGPSRAQDIAALQAVLGQLNPYLSSRCEGSKLLQQPELLIFTTNSHCTGASVGLAGIIQDASTQLVMRCPNEDDRECQAQAAAAVFPPLLRATGPQSIRGYLDELCGNSCWNLVMSLVDHCVDADKLPVNGDAASKAQLKAQILDALEIVCTPTGNGGDCGAKLLEFFAGESDLFRSDSECLPAKLANGCPEACKVELLDAKQELGVCWGFLASAVGSASDSLPPVLDAAAWADCGIAVPTTEPGSGGTGSSTKAKTKGPTPAASGVTGKPTDADGAGNKNGAGMGTATVAAIVCVVAVIGGLVITTAWRRFVSGKRGLEQLPFSSLCVAKTESYGQLYEINSSTEFDDEDDDDFLDDP